VIVFTDGERLGLAVDEIHDIVEDRLDIQSSRPRPGCSGTAVIAGRSTEVVDINAFLRRNDQDWFAARARAAQRKRVLLVDDSPFFLNLVGPALQSCNYEVVMASDGQEAITRLEQGERFDAIVSDIDMPRIDGFELGRRVAASTPVERDPAPRAHRAGGRGGPLRAARLGFRAFLPKFDRDTVLLAVRNVLNHHSEVPA
jgi:two-component system, chemotaxis family, sensor kinase CheA